EPEVQPGDERAAPDAAAAARGGHRSGGPRERAPPGRGAAARRPWVRSALGGGGGGARGGGADGLGARQPGGATAALPGDGGTIQRGVRGASGGDRRRAPTGRDRADRPAER